MRELAHNLKAVPALAPATLSADTNGLTIDRKGFESLTFAVMVGVAGDSLNGARRLDFFLQHSDNGTDWSNVGADNVVLNDMVISPEGAAYSLRGAHAAADVVNIGYVGGTIGQKRYVRLNLDAVGTHTNGTPIAAVAILGHPHWMPV